MTETKTTAVAHPREDWVAVPVPAIIDADLWAASRAQAAHNKANAARNSKRFYVFRGMLRCGLCNRVLCGDYSREMGFRYHCNNNARMLGAARCSFPNINEA